MGQRPRGHFGGLIPALVSGLPRHTQLHKQIATGYLHNYHDKSIPYGGLVTSAQKSRPLSKVMKQICKYYKWLGCVVKMGVVGVHHGDVLWTYTLRECKQLGLHLVGTPNISADLMFVQCKNEKTRIKVNATRNHLGLKPPVGSARYEPKVLALTGFLKDHSNPNNKKVEVQNISTAGLNTVVDSVVF